MPSSAHSPPDSSRPITSRAAPPPRRWPRRVEACLALALLGLTVALLAWPKAPFAPLFAALCLLPAAAAVGGLGAAARWSAVPVLVVLVEATVAAVSSARVDPSPGPIALRLAVAVLAGALAVGVGRAIDGTRRRMARFEDATREQARLVQASASRGQELVTNLSHELRTPLAGTLGLTEILLHGTPTPEQTKHLHLIQESVRGLLGRIDDLLELGDVTAGAVRLDLRRTDVRALVEQGLGIFAPRAVARDLELRFHLDEALPASLWVDPARLRQILVHLLSNAVKFTERGHVELRVDWSADASRLTVSVSDTGIGIAPSERERIFTPFEQVDSSVSRRFGGTGIGLAITRSLVELMDGSIAIESSRGAGSTFTVELPLRVASREPSSSLATPGTLVGRHVLVVEDDPINRVVTRTKLESLGLEVDVADGGPQALEFLRIRCVDAILMDCQMPDLDGYELSRRLRREPGPNVETPILALTAHTHPNERQRCLAAGMNDYLAKPVATADLEDRLAQWIHKGRMPETSGAVDAAIVEAVRRRS